MAVTAARQWLAHAIMTCLLLLSMTGGETRAATLYLDSHHARVGIDQQGGGLQWWQTCRQGCGDPVSRRLHGPPATALLRVSVANRVTDQRLQSLHYEIESRQARSLTLISAPIDAGVRLRLYYAFVDNGRRLILEVDITGDGAPAFRHKHELLLQLAVDAEFGISGSAGFTGLVERARWIMLRDGGVTSHAPGDTLTNAAPADWAGIRNRFWALLARQAHGRLTVNTISLANGHALTLTAGEPLRFELYAGPVEPAVLATQPGNLEAVWISGLWDWLRWLTMGLYYLLEIIAALIGNYALAIIALALAVKILMLPLTLIAAHWQQQVNATQARLQPELQRIKTEYRGEEQANRVLALHRDHGVTPFYPVKSLFGVLIQLPIFIGAFDMLLHHPGLIDAAFVWVENLAEPDRLLALPFAVPFFGQYLNLLPFLMTGMNVLAARQADAAGLSAGDHKRRRQWLYGMALLFFVLFYTFPAGMVLYWTSSNLFHWLGEHLAQRRRANRIA